jgi:aspartyl protease family protein
MSRTLILLLAALGVTLALLVWNHDSGTTAGMANQSLASLVMLGTLLASIVAGGMWYRGSITGALRDAALWLAIFLALGFLYQASPTIQALMAG